MEIPEGWREGRIADLISRLDAGISVNSGDRPAKEGEQAVLKTSCVSEWIFNPEENKVVSLATEKMRLKEPVQGDSIILSRMNTPALVGASAFIEHGRDNLFLPDRLWQAKPSNNNVCMRWLAEFLGSKRGRFILSSMSTGTSGTMKNITKPDVFSIRILIPPLPEQKSIAKILSTWDRAIEVVEKLIENSQAQKKALMQQLLTGKKRLPGFEGEWEKLPLENIFSFSKGHGLSKGDLSPDGEEMCVLYGELYTKYSEVIGEIFSRTDTVAGFRSKSGDILIPASTTTTGIDLANATAILEDNILLGGDINILRTKKSNTCASFFARYLTHTKKHEISRKAQGITIIHLYGNHLKPIIVGLPPIEEQEAITNVLNTCDHEITKNQQQLIRIKSEKSALMQQLLTGKRRVKIDKEAVV